MSEAREIERAGLVAMEAARNLKAAAVEAKEAATAMDWAVQRLREERLAWGCPRDPRDADPLTVPAA